MHLKKQIDMLEDPGKAYWSERLYSQLEFLYEMIQVDPDCDALLLEQVVASLVAEKQKNGCLGKTDVLKAEQALALYSSAAKSYRLHMVSHAHIDMDWRWGWDETVSIVVDTFHTMLRLLEEYPEFIYTQSQAAVYEIIERYAPELLPDIRKYVAQGRWEPLCTSWVENDKNLTGTEAAARHLLYSKRYISSLLGVEPDQQQIDFEPDSFGHSRHLPEILKKGGVRYYYHCRGNDQEELYRWRAPSGAELLVLRDPQWYYLQNTDYRICWHVPGFCARNHVKTAVRFYGVGDHGGGPSRRDIERIFDMQTWPLLPTMRFSRLHDFFHEVEAVVPNLPVVERELNFVFTGCYSAQARLKQANRQGEDRLFDSEALCAMAKIVGCDLHGMPSFEPAWRNILFNQFHDIVTGSCTRDAKERALGRFQDTCAISLSNAKRAMRQLGDRIATDAFTENVGSASIAESGGHGFGNWKGNHTSAVYSVNTQCNTGGKVRPYTLFNPTAYDREELVELTLWDWPESLEATQVCTADGQKTCFEVIDTDKPYWHHKYSIISFVAKIPAFGYCNYYVMPADQPKNRTPYFEGPRVHRYSNSPIILENSLIRATFKNETMELVSLMDKRTGRELIREPSAYFCLNEEETVLPHSAWIVGRNGKQQNLNQTCFVKVTGEQHTQLCSKVSYEITINDSLLKVSIFLPANATILRFGVEVDWHERGKEGGMTPQLQFCVPYSYRSEKVRYDVPGGYIDRVPAYHNVPGSTYGAPIPSDKSDGIILTSDCQYSFYAEDGLLCLTLLRSSVYPDRNPEEGERSMQIGLGITDGVDWMSLTKKAVLFSHPVFVYSNTIHTGPLPDSGSIIRVNGRANVTAFKEAEDGNGFVMRLVNGDDQPSKILLDFPQQMRAEQADILERKQGNAYNESVEIPAHSIMTVHLL